MNPQDGTYSSIVAGCVHQADTDSQVLEIRSPWDNSVAGRVALLSKEGLNRAVESAQKGFLKTKKLQSYERAQILSFISQRIKDQKEDFARLITAEIGKPIRFSRLEVDRAVFTFQYAAEEARRIGGEVLPMDLSASSHDRMGIVRRFPIGVILCIAPFNFPLNLVAHKVAPAIASGNAFILKPSPQAPLTSLKLGQIIAESGFPLEAVNVVICSNEDAQALVADERMNMLSFTGSASVGWKLKSMAGKKKVILELGGNAGVIIDASADIDDAVRKNVSGSFAFAGQVCIKVQRIFVHEEVFEEYLKKFIDAAKEVRCGDPSDPETIVGPVIDDAAVKRITESIANAADVGTSVIYGGACSGRVIEPTILVNAPAVCAAATEEIFGPVVTINKVATFAEALQGVNNSRFGLQAGVFTNDLQNIRQAYSELEVGAVIINENPTYRMDHMPYGGVKDSGFGREGVKYAMDAMTEPKLLALS
jgi:acyl-CoA reductase-like NAD-dependent aldehyde dehydrogenase